MQIEMEIDTSRLGTVEPFSGEPIEGIVPPAEALAVATNYLTAHYEDDGDAKQSAKIAKAYKAIQSEKLLAVLPNGKVRVQGSSAVYLVGTDCTVEGQFVINKKTNKHSPRYCPTYQGGKQGSCYHIWMKELVRVAQVFCLV